MEVESYVSFSKANNVGAQYYVNIICFCFLRRTSGQAGGWVMARSLSVMYRGYSNKAQGVGVRSVLGV